METNTNSNNFDPGFGGCATIVIILVFLIILYFGIDIKIGDFEIYINSINE